MNAAEGPAVYLCPDNFLIDQTCEQAKQFGILTCKADPELPDAFLNGEKLLVTSVQKLFNGLTKFGLKRKSIEIGVLLMDDAHACSDIIREQCRIRIPSDEPAYEAIKALFGEDLEQQGVGTYADICNDKRDAVLPVPYWSWAHHESEVAAILSTNADRNSIKFAWPLLRDILGSCQGVISGAAIEIEPYIPPLDAFGSYWNAKHRILMSATVTDDAFLVNGIQPIVEIPLCRLWHDPIIIFKPCRCLAARGGVLRLRLTPKRQEFVVPFSSRDARSLLKTWTDAHGNPIQCIHRYSRTVVGFSHPNKRGVDRMSLVQKLEVGTKLMLVPDPDNPMDRNAILVYAADDIENDIGYLLSSAAKYIARMMECGATFSAEVYYIHHGYKNYPEVCIFIYQLTPMTQKRRPIRKGAPLYKPEPSSARREHIAVEDRPLFESIESHPGNAGLWTRIKRLRLMG